MLEDNREPKGVSTYPWTGPAWEVLVLEGTPRCGTRADTPCDW